jgi:hypothetical protein
VIKDISFASPTVGYIAAELGRVWKTTDGGNTWTRIMNLGYPYYWYGVDALSKNDVVISGFDNSNTRGLLRWSHDGGQTWSSDVVLTTQGWSGRVRFADDQHGLVVNLLAQDRRDAHYTTTGGQTAADWTATTIAPWTGWWGSQFSLLPNLRARVSGIHYCDSVNGGAAWSCIPFGIDEVFDGATFFHDDLFGWVGGRKQQLGRWRPLLLGGRRTDVESRPRRRGRAGRLRPLAPRPQPAEQPSGVVRRLRQLLRRQGVHPQSLGHSVGSTPAPLRSAPSNEAVTCSERARTRRGAGRVGT